MKVEVHGKVAPRSDAGGGVVALDVIGEFDNAWSIPATVKNAGRCTVDLTTLIAKLKTYDQKTPIGFVLDKDGLRFGTTRLALHQER